MRSPMESPDDPVLECFTLLGALAMVTRRVKLAQLVACNSFRHPALTAKAATTLDHVSGGRLELGLGAGWFLEDHHRPPPSIRPMPQPTTAEPSAMAANSTPDRRSGWRVRTPLNTPTPSSVATENPHTAGSVAWPSGRRNGTTGMSAPITNETNMTKPALSGCERSTAERPSTFSWTVRRRRSSRRLRVATTRDAEGRSSPSAVRDSRTKVKSAGEKK